MFIDLNFFSGERCGPWASCCGSYAPWNLKNIGKSTNNLSFLCQFFRNEITASDAGPDIIRSHLLKNMDHMGKATGAKPTLGRNYMILSIKSHVGKAILFFVQVVLNRLNQIYIHV